MEWTPRRIRLLRDVGLCQSQHDFARSLGVATRTVGNAERGTHSPSLALRRALDRALEHASDIQRDRFLAAITTDDRTIVFPSTALCQPPFLPWVSQPRRRSSTFP